MSSGLTLRPATKEDQPAINRLIREGRINPLGTPWSRFVVAVDDEGTSIGCGQVRAHGDGSRELASLAVNRSWRRQGVAAAIINHLKEKHGAPLWLTCMDRLVPMYEKYDFERINIARETTIQVPAYYRRASRLFRLYQVITHAQGELAVMVWHGSENEKIDQSDGIEI
jgi:GNAT superfamily N-acetyltransferase